jgi:bifunctional non-homologous end joining protein LigD
MPFIPLASPKLLPAPPTGPEWLHEVKFDGFRIQLHKAGDVVRLYSRNGKDFTARFPSIAAAVRRLGAKDAVIDGELVSCDEADKPDFYALMRRRTSGLCVWCFDLLAHNDRDLRSLPLQQRKAKLEVLLRKTDDNTLRLSHTFADGEKLLHAAAQQGLEGIVSKRRVGLYLPGSASGWIKVKTAEWREANRERYKLFEKT